MANPAHRVLFELSAGRPEVWRSALNNVENVRKALGPGDTQVALVAHGKGLGLYLTREGELGDRLRTLAGEGVELRACANTLARLGLDRDALPAGIGVVDSGVAEVVRRQEHGWSYVKLG